MSSLRWLTQKTMLIFLLVSSIPSTPTVISSGSSASSTTGSSLRTLTSSTCNNGLCQPQPIRPLDPSPWKSSLDATLTSPSSESSFPPPSSSLSSEPRKVPKPPPRAKRIPRPLTLYNETLIDNYRWMHHKDQDPDVRTYIQQESAYTAAWIKQSGIEALQKQLEDEMNQIRQATSRKQQFASSFLLPNELPVSDNNVNHMGNGNGDNNAQDVKGDKSKKPKKPHVKHLEGTQFWDLDRWRYWLDEFEGDYGVYKRRPIPRDAYQLRMDEKQSTMPQQQQQHWTPSASEMANDGSDKPGFVGCSATPISDPKVESVLDVNRLARKQKHRDEGQFLFGSLEIQPQNTFLERGTGAGQKYSGSGDGDEESSETFVAYTYDVSGDERYHICIMTLGASDETSRSPADGLKIPKPLSLECDQQSQQPSPTTHEVENRCETLEQGWPLTVHGGAILKDAGSAMRWVKLEQSLYLYFTRLDSKGLSREVWRIKVATLETEDGSKKEDARRKQKFEPELVMREKDERNVLSVSLTNDQQYLLIESAGQTTSSVYFLSIDNPNNGWNLVRQAEENVIYKVEHHSGYFYLRTNHDGAINFKVLRIPVEYYLLNDRTSIAEPVELSSSPISATATRAAESPGSSATTFLETGEDEVVVVHDPDEFLERFEVFVEHLVGWVWRAGMQEIRIFLAPRAGDPSTQFPLKELHRIRPYDKESKVATVMPGNTKHDEERLFRDFYSTDLLYSNCSFVHPWALYEFDMHTVTPTAMPTAQIGLSNGMDSGYRRSAHSEEPSSGDDTEERLRRATRIVCRDPFPLGVHYGRSKAQSEAQDMDEDLFNESDEEEREKKEIAKFKEMRIMVPSTHGSKRNRTSSETADQGSCDEGDKKIMIPVSLIYYAFLDGQQFPRKGAFVNAYGAYGSLTSPTFDPEVVLPFLHRGLIYVQVHPRGDGILGPEWYADGKLENKLNTFYDVEDVLLYLRDSGIVEKEGCVIQGRSAGGLVSGWIANRWGEIVTPPPGSTIGDRPQPNINFINNGVDESRQNIVREMVKVVLAQVPFIDVIADMSDPDIPWVEYEWAEWGSPLESREIFETMKAYSPYDRIRNHPYPAMMIMGGLSDGRVSYAEPLKYVAKLRSIDGKTNDCQPFEELEGEVEGQVLMTSWEKGKDKDKEKMCAGKKDTPLLLQMENGGHFSGKSSLWMAFALHHLKAEKVVTGDSLQEEGV
ncbi:hypothetical protein BG011_003063 [Mortierella polycephala]|uniref:Prolyl endopeptidase-like n=1 Tax=Mortierella polycephala TaxID=41804 RepID=A0A9P6U444_9FUNG|nr:hypothetical protein BG011_003063 [Mortierella polycephala]